MILLNQLVTVSDAKLKQTQKKEFIKLSNIEAKKRHKLYYKNQSKFLDLYMKSL